MTNRKPVAPNNRHGRMSEFLSSMELQAFPVKYPKAIEEPTTKSWPRPGRQNSEGFGGGYRVRR